MRVFLRLLSYLKPYKLRLSTAIAAMLIFALFSSMSIWLVGPMFNLIFYPEEMAHEESADLNASSRDDTAPVGGEIKEKLRGYVNSVIIRETRMDSLSRLIIVILTVFLIKNLAFYINIYKMAVIEQGIIRDIRNELFGHIASQSLDYFNKARVGTLISRVTNDVQIVNQAITSSVMNLIRDPLLIIFYMFIVLIISWKLTLVAFSTSIGSVFVVNKIAKLLRRQSAISQEKMANITIVIQEAISGMKVVKAFAMEQFERRKFSTETGEYFKTMRKLMLSRRLASPINEYLGIIAIAIVLWYGGKQVIVDKTMNANDFVVYLFALFSLMQPIKTLGSIIGRIQEGIAAGERIFSVIDTVPKVKNIDNPKSVDRFRQSIEFEDVNFDYGDGTILSGINLRIRAGEIIALVGPSGAGKSTIVSLIPRFYDPSSGRIRLDGIDLREYKLDELRKLTGYVTQEIVLFNDSVRNNIAYGLTEARFEDVVSAAKTANAHEFIQALPNGYDTTIGDRGTRLSGGQQQRIAIARAVLNDPPILIFDEATSSLDSESERQVQEAIENLVKDRTAIVIAHRLSTVQKADRIIVIDDGRIVQEGVHDDLVSAEGIYSKLYSLQFP